MPLNVIIVGAGLAGLSTAIGFRRHGHRVTIFERRESHEQEQSGAGIQFQPNVHRILEEWGIVDELRKVAHDSLKADMRTYDEGSIVEMDWALKGHAWFGLRWGYKAAFRKIALERGVEIKEGCRIASIDSTQPAIFLDDGTKVEADLIIGADGSGSRVRQALFPDFKPALRNMVCFQITLPLDEVRRDPCLRALTNGPYNIITVAPGRSIFASPAPFQNVFDFQLIDHEYSLEQDPHPDLPNERIYDLAWLRERWADHMPAYTQAIERADSAFKWRFTEIYGLSSWSSKNGKVVLLGDSSHSMTPFAGQGTGMCIESAAVLSELLATASSGDDLTGQLAAYERLRRPRVEKVQKLARIYGATWSLKDPEKIKQRNAQWRLANHVSQADVEPDPDASYGSPAFLKWLDRYDVFDEVRKSELVRARL